MKSLGGFIPAWRIVCAVSAALAAHVAQALSLRQLEHGTFAYDGSNDNVSNSSQPEHAIFAHEESDDNASNSSEYWRRETVGDRSLMKHPCLNGVNKCYSAQQKLPPGDALILYQLAHIVTHLFEYHNVWYMASGGTLLGAVRNKGLIPHDDDVDFNILRNQGASIINSLGFKSSLDKNGIYLEKVHGDFWKCKSKTRPDLFVDIFAMIVVNDGDQGILTFRKGWWPGTRLPTSIMAAGGLKRHTYGASQIWGPTDAVIKKHFVERFGADWKTTVTCKGTYHECEVVQDTQHDLTQPAQPFLPLPVVKYYNGISASHSDKRELPHSDKRELPHSSAAAHSFVGVLVASLLAAVVA